MLDFYRQLAALLQDEAVVVATVIQVRGSAPREVGAKMIIRADGSIVGTIGGGAGEALVIDRAQSVLVTGNSQAVQIDLSGKPHRDSQGVCGGDVTVWLARWRGQTMLTLAHRIVAALSNHRSLTLVTPLSPHQGPYVLDSPTHDASLSILTNEFFTETLQPPPLLLIVGAGHCAIPLAHMAHLVGFQVVVQDDRPEFATLERFPDATMVLAQPIAPALATLAHVPSLYAALVTRGYTWDVAALTLLLQRPTYYIGMIGSHKRVKTVFQALVQAGVPGIDSVSVAMLQQAVHAPIGLDIGALTPEEIAVSICAELIQVRRKSNP
ncbi:MAG: XdhC family protein [Cyanobacteria bacterium]|nr:XdhC family protein [Cyanobacteriota bacterium]MDW8203075.1 XdhC family protein [Cyanobacteriota bacterium SKYGB_h_bin112]